MPRAGNDSREFALWAREFPGRWQPCRGRQGLDRLGAVAGLAGMLILAAGHSASLPEDASPASRQPERAGAEPFQRLPPGGREVLVAGYVGNPIYYRSNVRIVRPDGTDLKLKGLGWDGDALHFPIDGGVRTVRWGGSFGTMVDFLHNKAIARLGRGAHGRKLKYPVVEEVAAEGTWKGQPAPKRILLTKLFDRLEFTHGHNMLFLTGMVRFGSPLAWLRPYAGLGGGLSIPHAEVWFAGEAKAKRTNEYQYTGPAAQAVAGLEFQFGPMSYFLEYKFSYAWLNGALTSDESWRNFDMPGDLWRQFSRWWKGGRRNHGTFSTTLGAHQIIAGAGYRWDANQRAAK